MQEVTARLPFVPFVINIFFFLLFLKDPFLEELTENSKGLKATDQGQGNS